jgi:processive 1,2-diacylglycerol beta-glucosyltransferase
VAVVTASVGAGHNSAAKAIVAAIRQQARAVDAEYLDAISFAPRLFRAMYAGGYSLLVSRLPLLYGLGFWASDLASGSGRGPGERVRLACERRFLRRLADHLVRTQPDLIVHTHFLAPPVVAHLRRAGLLSSPQFVCVTDVGAHRYWYCPDVQRYFVAAPFSVQKLRTWGVEPERIRVSGLPVHPKWLATPDRRKVLADWNLPPDKHVVLLSGGTEFTCGPIAKLAAAIAKGAPGAVVAVLAGYNKRLLGKLSALSAGTRRIVPVSFTDRVNELVSVCSLMVYGSETSAEMVSAARSVFISPQPNL